MRRSLLLVTLLVAAMATVATGADSAAPRRHRVAPKPLDMVWHAEAADGAVLYSQRGDEPVNPASVMKIATTLWALETLGPDHHFETRAWARGSVDLAKKVLGGDLVIEGGHDPDFHPENAFMLASALNDTGVEKVTGALIVDRNFAMGWENGSEGRNPDPIQRGLLMATRLRQAMDPKRWNGEIRGAWREYAARHALDAGKPPRVTVARGVGVDGQDKGELLVIHRSQPLSHILRRFNCFSNNDIERVAEAIGPVDELAAFVAARGGVEPTSIQIETASGLGTNRLTTRVIVKLLHELEATCGRLGLKVEDLLPLAGCDPGTVARFFPLLNAGPGANGVVGKTGTLTATDGGVSVLAGFASTVRGVVTFCVAVPQAGGRLARARRAEEQWVLALLTGLGGVAPRQCTAGLEPPDAGAMVIELDRVVPPLVTASAPTAQ